jgi:nucleoside-diphosphate-sugar epimerase
MNASRNILVLGASGLIGHFVTEDLRKRGFDVVAVARKFAAGQGAHALDLEMPLLTMDSSALARLMSEQTIDVVVNCLGVLQDSPGKTPAPCIAILPSACCTRSRRVTAPSG